MSNVKKTNLKIYDAVTLTIPQIESYVEEIKPDIVYLPNKSDVHTDHGIVFNAVWSCVKSFRSPFVKEVCAYETVSETEFSAPLPSCAGFIPNTLIFFIKSALRCLMSWSLMCWGMVR